MKFSEKREMVNGKKKCENNRELIRKKNGKDLKEKRGGENEI